MKKVIVAVVALMLGIGGLFGGVILGNEVFAGDSTSTADIADKWVNEKAGGNDSTNIKVDNTIQLIINTLIGVVSVISVVMIIIGGITFATSQGDPGKVARGKNTLLYGIVGLVVAILSFAIVNFVLDQAFGPDYSGYSQADCAKVKDAEGNALTEWKDGTCKAK